jgi:hypothetical protein
VATKVYGASDDLIEFEGDVTGETGATWRSTGTLLMFSDGTLLEAYYGKGELAIWSIQVLAQGSLLKGVIPCMDEDAEIYSDIAEFNDGLKWAYSADEWERVE